MSVRIPSVPESAWFKSSYSGGNTTECVEVAVADGTAVLIRDSKCPAGRRVSVPPQAWADFVASLHG
ncbi:DUF397 domain-containing protein [Streptomyces spectabilis]|uniref:DUF397 domain-containing protein n=1 Tax=Streptomyces spectabilis TaxID=68270 RepID=A0A516R7Y4_STRST|nr:DUF397 domain-containing protein [Streptomyces spectabilis]QDQ11767.1 DUF397 domain-containing protein [Streptomyces spectabilis]